MTKKKLSDEELNSTLPYVGTTKDKLYAAYLAEKEKNETLAAQQLNPETIAAAKQKETVLTKANTTVESSVAEIVESVRTTVDTALTTLTSEFEAKTEELKNLDVAITLQNGELEEVYGIQREAGTLAALINAHEATKEKQALENADIKQKHAIALEEIKRETKDAEKEHQTKLAEQKAIREQEQKRAEAEWNYDFKRKQQQKEDELADLEAAKKKEFAEREAALQAREDAVKEREDKINELEAKVAEIPTLIATAESKAAGKAKGIAEKEAKFEVEKLEATKNAEIRILENKVELMQSQLDTERETNKGIAGQLSDAYARLENVATASVEGQKAQETISKIVTMANEKSGK